MVFACVAPRSLPCWCCRWPWCWAAATCPSATCRAGHRRVDPHLPADRRRRNPIVNTNGVIDVEGVDGSTVEVRAERIAKGATEAAASELLPRIVIKEEAKPDPSRSRPSA